jgi:hypothetical protein
MARSNKHIAEVETVRPYLQGVAKNLVDKLYGPDGPPWGTRLSAIEGLLLELRAVLTEEMLAQALARQAATHERSPDAYRRCPRCGQPLACPDANPRLLQTDAGEARWSEPEGTCDRCRRAFFPSIQEPGR